MKTKPLTANDLLLLASNAVDIPLERALATFADRANWVQIYKGKTTSGSYKPRACEWAFIGPVRPPFELAQNALRDAKLL